MTIKNLLEEKILVKEKDILFCMLFTEQLLPNLENPSIIILDNASYHPKLIQRIPATTWRKEELQSFLKANNIAYNSNMLKMELYALAKDAQVTQTYEIDELANEWGHKVLRLPPYHCQFNPTELVWAKCKLFYNQHSDRDGYMVMIRFWQCGQVYTLSRVNAKEWRHYTNHVEKEMEFFWVLEIIWKECRRH
ncbi:uncharacterized protein [Onthophagus taurus]|uniref:uncharacterized protein n=1 Tax=Onthophagus taurus TaxID=166361 RepID=UPI0039BE99EC